MRKEQGEYRWIFGGVVLFFVVFLMAPLSVLLMNSLQTSQGLGFSNYAVVLQERSILLSVGNSITVSALAAAITTVLAFVLSYAVNCTNIHRGLKGLIKTGIVLPMLLPTITYGFAIMYSFGKQGLLTRMAGGELFSIYGIWGLLLGYVIYTLPPAFLLLNNAFGYIDKKFIIVSELMGDSFWRGFCNTIVQPLLGALGGVYVVSFILSFTDFGIPASLGGTFNVIATDLYQVMLGAVPNFAGGAVIAMLMLLPAVAGVLVLGYLEKFNFHYETLTDRELPGNTLRDGCFALVSLSTVLAVLSVFVVMFVAPLVKNFPYDMSFSLQFLQSALLGQSLLQVYENSLLVALASAAAGTIGAYGAALINVRTAMHKKAKMSLDLIALATNTVPGMVLGLAYLLLFNDSDIKGTFFIIIACNIVHFFATPYLMAKNSLGKLNSGWEITGELMGDTWLKTVVRVIIPNSGTTIVEMFSYYFINAMVTISAIIFLVAARTSVVTSKIKELQHYANFNEIFILSILIFITNMLVKIGCDYAHKKMSSL